MGQEPLWSAPRREGPGRHEQALDAAAAARALDDAELAGRPQVVAQLLRSYGDLLDRLHLLPPEHAHGDPLARGEGSGAALLALVDGAGAAGA